MSDLYRLGRHIPIAAPAPGRCTAWKNARHEHTRICTGQDGVSFQFIVSREAFGQKSWRVAVGKYGVGSYSYLPCVYGSKAEAMRAASLNRCPQR